MDINTKIETLTTKEKRLNPAVDKIPDQEIKHRGYRRENMKDRKKQRSVNPSRHSYKRNEDKRREFVPGGNIHQTIKDFVYLSYKLKLSVRKRKRKNYQEMGREK